MTQNHPTPEKLKDFLNHAVRTAEAAGKVTLDYFGSNTEIEIKADNTPVTIADKRAEETAREMIQSLYPEHSILGEEFGVSEPDAVVQWVIDPIDGTYSFIHGIPLYTVLIAVVYNGTPIVGVIHNPVLSETVSAAEGLGCFYNGDSCQVSSVTELSKARVHVTDAADLYRRRPEFAKRLFSSTVTCRTWGDAHGYLLVSTGRADVMIDPVMNFWDIAPLHPIITEAGGLFTDLDGNHTGLGESALASNEVLHKQVLDLLS